MSKKGEIVADSSGDSREVPSEDSEDHNEPTTPDPSVIYEINEELHSQGAEARLHKCLFLGRPAVQKVRFSKKYRHPLLDRRLTKERLRNEMKSIMKCKEVGIDVPALYFLNTETNALIFEQIQGLSVKDWLAKLSGTEEEKKAQILRVAASTGRSIARLHQANIAHGDLTTSNLMLRSGDPDKVVLLDFGLSSNRNTPEDFGVDLYVLERAIRTTHVDMAYFMEEILRVYAEEWKGGKATLNKLDEIRLRGRKRDMVG